MNSLILEIPIITVQNVDVSENDINVYLNDGRKLSVPIAWFPRLLNSTTKERNNWRLIAGGEGIHWPNLDEDISVENLIMGKQSGESQNSLKRWLKKRANKRIKVSKRLF